MSWRTVVISSNAKLDYQVGYLVVRKTEETRKIHIDEIGTLIVENTAVSLTAYLLQELVHSKVKVIFCDHKRNPSSELLPYYGCHDSSVKVRRQTEWSEEDRKSVWTEIVTEKIRNQAKLLKLHKKSEAEMLDQYVKEMQFGDASNREGHAAKVYFNALFGKSFTRTEDSPINAALNYGYSILLSMFNREVVANGYITQLGLFHNNMFNQFNLASDLMEPFRPIVDRKVLDLRAEKFEVEEKHSMLEMVEEEIVIENRQEYLGNAVKIYTRSVFDAINDRDVSKISFYEL